MRNYVILFVLKAKMLKDLTERLFFLCHRRWAGTKYQLPPLIVTVK